MNIICLESYMTNKEEENQEGKVFRGLYMSLLSILE